MLVSINDHLLVLPAGMPSKHPGELLASKRLLETIQTLRQMGIIILDTPPATHSADSITLSSVADATLFVAKSGATRMRSVQEATNGLRRDRIRQLGVILVGTRSPWLGSLTTRGGDLRDQADAELEELEPMPTRTVPFNPRPPAPAQEPAAENGERALRGHRPQGRRAQPEGSRIALQSPPVGYPCRFCAAPVSRVCATSGARPCARRSSPPTSSTRWSPSTRCGPTSASSAGWCSWSAT